MIITKLLCNNITKHEITEYTLTLLYNSTSNNMNNGIHINTII